MLEKTLESPLDCKEIKPVNSKVLNIHWKDWCWSSNTLATWWEELTHWKRPDAEKDWGGEGADRGRDDWMASPTQWTQVWASSRNCWRTRKPGVLQSMELQRVGHNWETELNHFFWGLPLWLSGKEPTCNAGDAGSFPASEKSLGGGNGNPLQYSCLENSMNRRIWQAQSMGCKVGHDWEIITFTFKVITQRWFHLILRYIWCVLLILPDPITRISLGWRQ